jgi:polysaccharide deacetylase family protein (PEP-CTERM system associated)
MTATAGTTVGGRRHATPRSGGVSHHFTIDVEEYFHVSALERAVSRAAWEEMEPRAAASTADLLDLLDAYDTRATFFVLGWLAERSPGIVREIARRGHEVASHGWDHRRVTGQQPDELRESIRRSKRFLEDLCGGEVAGFRAPSFSITRGMEWALDLLLEEGYRYDSSLFPVRRSGYGYTGGRRDPHWIDRPGGRIAEFPPATLRVAGINLPAAGGAYLRLLPFGLVHGALSSASSRRTPATLYVHPWEWDVDQPRFPVPMPTRVRHYGGLRRTWGRMERLLGSFRFRPIRDSLEELHS